MSNKAYLNNSKDAHCQLSGQPLLLQLTAPQGRSQFSQVWLHLSST